MLRIGRIAYANCTPIFAALREQAPADGYQLIAGVPARLNAMLAAGDIDVCPSSSFEYACHPERYLILPDLSISSIGEVGSVLLFSSIPIEELSGHTLLLSAESATSVNLLRILMALRFGCACSYQTSDLPLGHALEAAPAMLLIGDAALRASMGRHTMLVYDLGKLWYEWTGLPFVFALWLCSRQVAVQRPAEVAAFAGRLSAAKAYACSALDTIAQGAPETAWMGKERLVDYWRENISYDLGERHREGLTLFYRYCAELGLLQQEPELRFLTSAGAKESQMAFRK